MPDEFLCMQCYETFDTCDCDQEPWSGWPGSAFALLLLIVFSFIKYLHSLGD